MQALPLQSESVQAIPLRGAQVGYELFESNGTGGRYVFQTESLMPTEVTGNYSDRQFVGDVERLRTLDFESMSKEEIEALYIDVNLTRDMRF